MRYSNSTLKLASSYAYKYPKFLLLIITFIIAYLIFHGRNYQPMNELVISLGYFGTFLTGMLFAYGFTAAPATSIFLILSQHQNIYLACLIGGLGALISDLLIFKFIRVSFNDEIEKLSNEKIVLHLNNHTPSIFKRLFLPVLAGFIIASPLPDEIGVSLAATIRTISTRLFSVMSYVLNTAGILIILIIGKGL